MRAFIYDKYGYYSENEDDTTFMIKDWKYELLVVEKEEIEIQKQEEYLQIICQNFSNMGVSVIKNRDGNYLSSTDFGNVVLLAIKQVPINIDDLIKFHRIFAMQGKMNFTIGEIVKLWEDKVDLIEKRIIPSIKIDDFSYATAMEITIHGIGLAENAIQYLSELALDFGKEVPNLTLTHKRLNSLDASIFLNPFNFIVDSPMRDLAELYKAGNMQLDQLLNTLNIYNINSFEASLLFARVLFPTCLFDCLEDHFGDRKDVRSDIFKFRQTIQENESRIKLLHQALFNTYHIRPISWLFES